MAALPRVTVLQLDPGVSLGRFEDWLRAGGVRLSVVTLWDKDVPQLASSGQGLLVLGGRMSAHDHGHHRWIDPLADLLADAQAIDLPILGICLGHQILAEALGGHVHVADPGGGEEGPAELEWLPAATDDPVLGALAEHGTSWVAQSHHDVVATLAPGATELARSRSYPNQAFRLGSALGVQFHPEADPAAIGRWSTADPARREELVRATAELDEQIRTGARQIATGFAQHVRTES